MNHRLSFAVRSNRISDVSRRYGELLENEVERTARNVQARAVSQAPVDTGFLRASIEAAMSGVLEWTVSVGAEYGAYVNFGTRRMAPRPFFTNAVEAERPLFVGRIKAIERSVL